jgi:hypothetical protein
MPHELVVRLLSELAAARATIGASYDRLWPSDSKRDVEPRDETAPSREGKPLPRRGDADSASDAG